jgi:hypothetical protein
MAPPKGSMADGYVLEETLGFMIEYLHEFEHVSKKIWDAEEEERIFGEVSDGVPTKKLFIFRLCDLAHDYALTNTKIMGPWIQ